MFGNLPALLGSSLNLILGCSLLLAGRKLFWLLVGVVGFLIGLEVAPRLAIQSEILSIGAALVLGLVFALMAILLESVAIAMAGFLGGGIVALRVARVLGVAQPPISATTFVLGGILGILLIVLLFDWALITISSLAGAAMIAGTVLVLPAPRVLVFAGLLILGAAVQGLALLRGRTAVKVPPQSTA